jgi:hypothetical protein
LQFLTSFFLQPVAQLPKSGTHRKYPHLSVVLLLKNGDALLHSCFASNSEVRIILI